MTSFKNLECEQVFLIIIKNPDTIKTNKQTKMTPGKKHHKPSQNTTYPREKALRPTSQGLSPSRAEGS